MRHGRLLILGNGGAALSAARAARASGHLGEIHLASDVEGPAFNPMLAPYFLKGALPWERCFPFGAAFYDAFGITCHLGAEAERLDTRNREVTLASGERISYDRCLVATGAGPIVPPVPGLKASKRAFFLRTAASVRQLEEAIPKARSALVLGASFVGLKVAEILTRRQIRVTLLDCADQVLPGGAHGLLAAAIQALFERHGVEVRLRCAMEGVEGAGNGVVCHFRDGKIEAADLVVVCTGVKPNIGFLDPMQVRTDEAVLVDERLETSVQGLYAAGDACQGINIISGKHEWLATWENACLQGRVAGRNMAGESACYPGSLPQNIGLFFEWTYAHLGDVRGDVKGDVRGDVRTQGHSVLHRFFGSPSEGRFLVLALSGDILVGANLINCAHLAGGLRRAIRERWRWEGPARDGLTLEGIEKALRRGMDDFRSRPGTRAPTDAFTVMTFSGKRSARHGQRDQGQ
ncbi:MAG: FAD/NAD(P)-binding oxidoreductase [Syntrophorhabdales bacterium]|jgi:NADPH-dependent 2,4-dienoyl-CoA reductase/sulfur reductase-like enzyme